MNKTVVLLCLFALQGCSTITPEALKSLDGSVSQAIIVQSIKNKPTQAQLSTWQRSPQGWQRVCFISATIGRNGMAPVGQKKEGDGKTPSGTYPLGYAFGYAPSENTGLDYRQAGPSDFWVDDIRSMQYNHWVSGIPAAHSFEHLKRNDGLYRYAVVIGYNMNPIIPGAGSAIFLHVWRRYDSPTAGCVAVNQRNLRRILRWLNQKNQPVIILE